MKKRSRKTASKATKKWSIGAAGLLALGICIGSSSLQGADLNSNCAAKGKQRQNIQHEMVPHVVLPETIQYDKIAKSHRTHPGLDHAGDYGMVSPYVATYTPFPSYQIPLVSQMRTVNQSVYPVSPPMPALPLPGKTEAGKEKPLSVPMKSEELVSEEKESPQSDTDVAPILLASGREEVVHAAPLSQLNSEVTQTGIFCQKPAKPPAAWSFSSPIFKAASVPMGWGPAGHTGYISQYGPRGCQTQIGFQPMGGEGMAAQQGGMMPYPTNTFQMGQGAGMNTAPQIQMLPNGMLMVTMPPNHAGCGLLRCRCGNQPRTIFLPAGQGGMPGAMPGGMPGMMPQPGAPAGPEAMMMMPGMMSAGMGMAGGMPMSPMVNPVAMQGMPGNAPMHPMMAASMQPQMMPVTMMTQFGPMVVGYRQSAPPMMGMGMMQAAYAQQMMQQSLQQQLAQYQAMQQQVMQLSGMPQRSLEQENGEASNNESSQEPKAPLPINAPMMTGMVNPYALYSQQVGADGQPMAQDGAACEANQAAMMQPMMMFSPPMMAPQMMQGGNSFAGMYMTPFGMMAMAPTGGMNNMYGMNPMDGMGMGYGMMNPGMMNAGFGGQPMMNQGGMSVSDVVQLVMLLNNNNGKKERRFRLFQRIAERREARRGGQNDPLNMLMQAWATPYTPADSVVRMPSRNAYPYGYFGAQVGPQDTANYGGFYNLYMGNTSYPGLY